MTCGRKCKAVTNRQWPSFLDVAKNSRPCLCLCAIQAGGFVEDKRVNGTLAVARAIGDFSFKMGSIPAEEQQVHLT